MTTPEQIVAALHLQPHPREGGYFVESYRSAEVIPQSALPERYRGPRAFSTAIYYLLTRSNFSEMHRLATDEVFHFYLGDPVEMLLLRQDGTGGVITLGPNPLEDMQPQVVVPRGVWQGARLRTGGSFALLGTTVAPGFEYADYEPGNRDALARAYPHFRDLVAALTR